MTVRTDINVDWYSSPRILTIASPSTSISIQDLVDTCRILESDINALDNSHLVNAAGKEDLGGGLSVGITVTLLNAKVAFEARPPSTYVQCEISGGNLVALDENGSPMNPVEPTAYTQIAKTLSSSATILSSDANEISSQVWSNSNALTVGKFIGLK